MSKEGFLRLYIVAAAIFWFGLVIFSYQSTLSITLIDPFSHQEGARAIARDLCFSLFTLVVFLYYKLKIGTKKRVNFNELLWEGFVTGAMMVFALLITKLSIKNINPDEYDVSEFVFINFFYLINLIFIAIFLIKTFFIFKRMILYQKTKNLLIAWRVFEYTLMGSIALNMANLDIFNSKLVLILSFFSLFGLILAVNLKWVAYLNFRQKWRSILVIFLILLIAITFLQYVFQQSSQYGRLMNNFLVLDLTEKLFVLTLFSFIILYCLSSILVILFNLPTSSVFEQKFGEVLSFRKLSESIQADGDEEQIYEILLETSMSTVMADAAWLEIYGEDDEIIQLAINIEDDQLDNLIDILRTGNNLREDTVNIRYLKRLEGSEKVNQLLYKSVLTTPLRTLTKNIGTLGLIKNVEDGFDKEIVDVTESFAQQASISIENTRLLAEALENERYKEEIKIAKKVQNSLLPSDLIDNERVKINAFSQSANEVGGDYYDIFELSETRFAVTIGDVSGHGTTAAFNMAQLKGIFQSLIQLDLSPRNFMIYANSALSRCLDRKSFLTLSIFFVDTDKKEITYSRAGHCPTIYYSKEKDESYYFKNKGIGLGIIRSEDFVQHANTFQVNYQPGDMICLYTDGIVEAKNSQGEEFGYDRLIEYFHENRHIETDNLIPAVIDKLYDFTNGYEITDDYSLLIIKFK